MKRKRKPMTTLDYMRQNVKWGMLAFAIIFIIGIFIGPGFGSYGSMQCGKSKQPASQEEYNKEHSDVLAQFGDEKFTEYMINRDYQQRLEYYKSQSVKGSLIPPEDLLALKWTVLESNIESKIKIKMAREEEIKIDNKEVEKQFNETKNQIVPSKPTTQKNLSLYDRANLYLEAKKSERDFLAFLHARGLSAEKIREQIKDSLLVQKYDEKLEKEAKDEVKADAKKKAATIFNRIVTDKEDFNKIAKNESDDTASAQKEGLVENETRKDAQSKGAAFATTLFTAEIGKAQQPVEADEGFYILKVEGRILATGSDYEAAKPGIIADLKKELGITDEAPKEETKDEKNPDTKKEDEKKITDEMIMERYEKVTYRMIFVRNASYYERVNEKVKKLKQEANVEYIDPMIKAYSYVSEMGDNKDYGKAVESFKAIKEQKKPDWEKAKAELADKEAKLKAATTEDKQAEIEPEVSTAEDYLVAIQVGIAQIDYLIANFMKMQIDETMQKRMQEFYDKKNKEPEKYKDLSAPEATPEEKAKVDEMKKEMRTLLEEAVSFVDTPEPYYNALLGDLYLESKEWDKAHEQWAIVVDYVVSDPNLLQRASAAYNSFMDSLTDTAAREKAGKEFDKMSRNLAKAQEEQKKVQEEQQKRFQKMIEEQMKQQGGADSGSTEDTTGG